jgi:hypothetical protein
MAIDLMQRMLASQMGVLGPNSINYNPAELNDSIKYGMWGYDSGSTPPSLPSPPQAPPQASPYAKKEGGGVTSVTLSPEEAYICRMMGVPYHVLARHKLQMGA